MPISSFRIVLVFGLVLFITLFTFPTINFELNRNQSSNEITVEYQYFNSTPETNENLITSILESVLSQIPNLNKIESKSTQNSGEINLIFENETNLDYKRLEIASLIRRVYKDLPEGTTYPSISLKNNSPSKTAVLTYAITANQETNQIKNQVENILCKQLYKIANFSNYSLTGYGNDQLTIVYDIEKLNSYGIKVEDIKQKIISYGASKYPGKVSVNVNQYLITNKKALEEINEIYQLQIISNKNQIVFLKDLCQILIEPRPVNQYYRINGQNNISLSIYADRGTNTIQFTKHIKAFIIENAKKLPKGYKCILIDDNTSIIKNEIHKNYIRIFISLLIITLFILLTYRNWKYFFVLIASIFASLSITSLLFSILNISVSSNSISGLTVSFGILCDYIILTIEEYNKRKSLSILNSLLLSGITVVFALSAFYFLPSDGESLYSDFSLIVILSILSSILIVKLFIPSFLKVLSPNKKKSPFEHDFEINKQLQINSSYYTTINFFHKNKYVLYIVILLTFGIPLFLIPKKLEGNKWYHRIYNTTFGNTYYQENLHPFLSSIVGGSSRMFYRNVFETSLPTYNEKTKIIIKASLPYGTVLDEMNLVMKNLEKYLENISGIKSYITHVESGENATMEITFKDKYEKSSLPLQLKSQLMKRSIERGGVEWSIYGIGNGFNLAGNEQTPRFKIILSGYNYNQLETESLTISKLLSTNSRIKNINNNDKFNYDDNDINEYVLNISDRYSTLLGINKEIIIKNLNELGENTNIISYINLQNVQLPIILKEKNSNSFNDFRLKNDLIQIDSVKVIRLNYLGDLKYNKKPGSIYKENRQYIRVITFDYIGSVRNGISQLNSLIKKINTNLPNGYEAKSENSRFNLNEPNNYLNIIFILLLVNYILFAIFFESFKYSLYISTLIPLSYIGVFITFSMGKFYFDEGGFASFVILGGLVTNSSVLILREFIRSKQVESSLSNNQLLLNVITERSRTILLTTVATCVGLVPFLFTSHLDKFWFSFSIGTIGGLIFSLFCVFIILPIFIWEKEKK